MANYDRSVRPSRNAAEPLNITFGLALTQIIDVVSADCDDSSFLSDSPAFFVPMPADRLFSYMYVIQYIFTSSV